MSGLLKRDGWGGGGLVVQEIELEKKAYALNLSKAVLDHTLSQDQVAKYKKSLAVRAPNICIV